jgi:hypothetical protein
VNHDSDAAREISDQSPGFCKVRRQRFLTKNREALLGCQPNKWRVGFTWSADIENVDIRLLDKSLDGGKPGRNVVIPAARQNPLPIWIGNRNNLDAPGLRLPRG